jgi:hypothetical protein
MSVLSAPSPLPDQAHCKHTYTPTQVKGLMRVICKLLDKSKSFQDAYFLFIIGLAVVVVLLLLVTLDVTCVFINNLTLDVV